MAKLKTLLRRVKKKFSLDRPMVTDDIGSDQIEFICNICGKSNTCATEKIDREIQSCINCGSTVRMRSIIHLLSVHLYGESIVLRDFPHDNNIKGIGLSDWEGYAQELKNKFDYTNTYFHQQPYLDIVTPPEKDFGKYDFIISSDVFEHVPPPSRRAFEGAYNLLKPGGILVLTVPFTNEQETKEHFPYLNEYQVTKFKDKDYILVNKTKNGEFQIYKDLVFHGGPGTTLEMRVFCRNDISQKLENTGFERFEYFDSDLLKYGILHKVNWSLPILAVK